MSSLIPSFINFALLCLILWKYLKQPVRDYTRGRHEQLKRDIETVREALAQARAQHAEFSAKIRGMNTELDAIREDSQRELKETKQRVLKEAQELSAKIVSDARESAQAMTQDLARELSKEIGTQVLDRAEKLIRDRLTGDDRARLRDEFSKQVGGSP